MSRPQVIVLVPVRNEAWILPRFLQCTSLWADHIIVADQQSEDGSAAIARTYPKVTVIENRHPEFNEFERQKLLIEAARKIEGPKLLMALDADEILSANVLNSPEWQAVLQTPPGTKIELAKVDLAHSPATYFLHSAEDKDRWMPFGYMDDGVEHEGTILHTCRIPDLPFTPRLRLNEIVLLHYNRCNLPRYESKDRWYRCFERVTFPQKSVVEITRLYDWYDRLKHQMKVRPVKPEWFAGYAERGIDLTSIDVEPVFWWDWDILRMFNKYGTEPFRYLDIWDFDWEALRQKGLAESVEGMPPKPIIAPTSKRELYIRKGLKRWQNHPKRRYIDFTLKRLSR